jgi:hypothetical protein
MLSPEKKSNNELVQKSFYEIFGSIKPPLDTAAFIFQKNCFEKISDGWHHADSIGQTFFVCVRINVSNHYQSFRCPT